LKAINSRENAQYKGVKRLVASAAERRKRERSVLDGAHLLAAFLDAGHAPDEVYVTAAGLERDEVARLVERAAPAPVTLLSEGLFNDLSTVETPTGVIAVVRTPPAKPAPPTARFVLALEDIQDPGNVGMLLRSAAAAGAEHVLLSPACAFAWSPKVLRAGMGAHFATNIVERVDLVSWIGQFQGTSVALDGWSDESLYDLALAGPVALLVGNEGSGLSPALAAAATVRAKIPMSKRMESLNAAAAGTVALFEAARQRALE
jgi:TrmH family RNA methyltransferase